MLRYLAILWNHCNAAEDCAANHVEDILVNRKGWTCRLVGNGLAVYTTAPVARDGDVVPMLGHTGILLGVAFSKRRVDHAHARYDSLQALDADTSAGIVQSDGRSAIDDLWGSYVLFFSKSTLQSHYVLRSPAGLLPCFHAQLRGLHVFFAAVEDFRTLREAPLAINWPVIRAQSAGADYLTRETALETITSLESGECFFHTGPQVKRSFYWNPCAISQGAEYSPYEMAVTSIRQETLRGIHSWASRYNRILLKLSGGLDSAIVLAGLTTAPNHPHTQCVAFYSTDYSCDDPRCARAMARKAGAPLLEVETNASAFELSLFLHCARTARPALNFTAPAYLRGVSELPQCVSYDAVFDGELGDNVFGFPTRAEPIADYIQRNGLLPGVLLVARDLARIKRLSVWRALLDGFSCSRRIGWLRSRHTLANSVGKLNMDRLRLVTSDVLLDVEQNAERFCHPWFREGPLPSMSSATLIQALVEITSTSYHTPFSFPSLPHFVRPLVSQPLIEVALRTPAMFAIRSGWNRATARAAFSHELPHEVLFRTSKSTFDPLIRRVIRGNISWMREFLLDGVLAKEGILDKRRVSAVLSDTLNLGESLYTQLFAQLYIEGWLRQWVKS